MPTHRTPGFRFASRILAGLLLAGLGCGCASFRASRGLDVSPFAQNTVGMIGEVQKASRPVVWIHLKKYDSLPIVQECRRVGIPTRSLMRGVGLYSTQIVSIYGSPMPESRKVAELARYMEENVRPSLISSAGRDFISPAELDAAVKDMRAAKSFLAALGAAQPLVSGALAFGNSRFDSLGQCIDEAASDISRRIETEFAPLKEQIAALEALQIRAVRSYTLLSRYRLGASAALDTLRAGDPSMAELLPEGKRPSTAALDAAEQSILGRLGTIRSLRDQLASDYGDYRAQQLELDELRTQANENVRLGRITLILWAQSHQNLAAGITVPAAIDVMGIVRGAAGKAVSIP